MQDVAIQNPIDVEQIKDSSWMRPVKKQAERNFLEQIQYGMQPFGTEQTQETTEEPAARRMGFGQGGGAAQVTGYQQFIEPEPANFTEWIAGRINTPIEEPQTIIEEPEIIEKKITADTLDFDYKKLALVGIGIFAILAVIIWRKKLE